MLPSPFKVLYLLTFAPAGLGMFQALFAKGLLRRLLPRKRPEGEKPRVLILAYLNRENASARHRVYKHVAHLEKAGFTCTVAPPTDSSAFTDLFSTYKPLDQYRYFLRMFKNRFRDIWSADRHDVVLLQRSVLSEFFYDPPLFIFALKLINPNLVYDFDDAVFMLPPHSTRGKSRLLNFLASLRFRADAGLSRKVIASTPYLSEAVRTFSPDVATIPTPVDVENYQVRKHAEVSPVTLGWTGGGGNLAYLKMIERPLARLARRHDLRLRIVSNREFKLPGIPTDYVPWSLETESTNMSGFDIGLMPLAENAYTLGKCGFKLMQYMASGVPAVASPVGVNQEIVRPGQTGFLASSEAEWETHLESLITDVDLRRRLGKESRKVAEREFSYRIWAPRLVEALTEATRPY